MKFQSQQHLHNSHITRQIQVILSPFLLPILVSLLVLTGYRSCLSQLQSISVDNSGSVIDVVVSQNGSDLVLSDDEWDPFSQLREDVSGVQRELYQLRVQDAMNTTAVWYEAWMESVVSGFESTLDSTLERYQDGVDFAEKITKLVKELNSTVLNELSQKNDELATIKSEISGSMSIGESIDVSDMSIDVDSISDDFAAVIGNLSSWDDEDDLVSLNESRSDFIDDVQTLFGDAIDQITGYDTKLDWTVPDTNNTTMTLTQTSKSTDTSSSNSTSTDSPSASTSTDTLRNALVSLGCCLVVGYILVTILNHFHFQYASQLRKETYLSTKEFAFDSDLEKDTERQGEDEAEEDFNLVYTRLRAPLITMITDSLAKRSGNWYKVYWCTEYFLLRVPLVLIILVGAAVVLLGVDKESGESEYTVSTGSNTTDTTTTQKFRLEFPSVTLPRFSEGEDYVNEWNNFIEELNQNVTSSLEDLFDQYKLSDILLLETPSLPEAPQLSAISNTSSTTYKLPNITFVSTTELSTTTSVSISSILSSISAQAIKIVRIMVMKTCVLILCVLGGLCLTVLIIGLIFSMFM